MKYRMQELPSGKWDLVIIDDLGNEKEAGDYDDYNACVAACREAQGLPPAAVEEPAALPHQATPEPEEAPSEPETETEAPSSEEAAPEPDEAT